MAGAEPAITDEYVGNTTEVRRLLGKRGIVPEQLPPSEDVKKVERRVTSEEKKLPGQVGRLESSEDEET